MNSASNGVSNSESFINMVYCTSQVNPKDNSVGKIILINRLIWPPPPPPPPLRHFWMFLFLEVQKEADIDANQMPGYSAKLAPPGRDRFSDPMHGRITLLSVL